MSGDQHNHSKDSNIHKKILVVMLINPLTPMSDQDSLKYQLDKWWE